MPMRLPPLRERLEDIPQIVDYVLQTLQKQKRDHNPPIPSKGEYCGLFTRHTGSRALMAGDTGFPYIPTLEGDTAELTRAGVRVFHLAACWFTT